MLPKMDGVIAAVICAAGSSNRMGGQKKEYRLLENSGSPQLTVLASSVKVFSEISNIKYILISIPENGEQAARQALPPGLLNNPSGPEVVFVAGGPSRRASVYNALLFLKNIHPGYVLIHDGARPWIDRDLVERCINGAIKHGAVLPVMPLVETPKEIDSTGAVIRHLKRASLVGAQTPQAFVFSKILEAHIKAAKRESSENYEYTDDAEIWGEFIGPVMTVPGSSRNKKITFPEDLPEPRKGVYP